MRLKVGERRTPGPTLTLRLRHTLTPADVYRLYPRTPDYLAVRQAVDPGQKFANAHLSGLFGLSAPQKA